MKLRLGLSTSWNAFRHTAGDTLLFEIKELGFKAIELGFNLTSRMVDDIRGCAEELQIKILSVHNYCPVPAGLTRDEALPDYYSLASTDENQRRRAITHTKKSIDTAQRLGAKAVVLHCGRVEIPDKTVELIKLHNSIGNDAAEFRSLREKAVRERKELAQPFFENALKSLEELNCYAAKISILLGAETRYYYREIPCFEEIGIILRRFQGSNIFYWHDTGHAQLMENLGFARHREYLESYGNRIIGMHLHDIKACLDHQALLNGEIDFALFKPYLKDSIIKILEIHKQATAADIIKSKVYLEGIFSWCRKV